jgi:rhodanese-related sulfurtransferase
MTTTSSSQPATATTVSPAAAVQRVREGGAASIIDVRTPFEYRQEHIAGTLHTPLEQLIEHTDRIRAAPAPRLLLCRSGKRAEIARHELAQRGIEDLAVIEGGIIAYAAAGGDTVRAISGMSLERQVRIVAGTLVVIATLLGFLLHPAFHLVSLVIGAGLVFAGVTDRCGMALMLTRLPWNRVDGGGAAT